MKTLLPLFDYNMKCRQRLSFELATRLHLLKHTFAVEVHTELMNDMEMMINNNISVYRHLKR